ncbi:MAG TPA: 50S ribosomal protein L29 [Planctomycetota bacterium]|nr:50S ribosomal protein L29 [Planctomycetota bacterium]
MKQISEIRGKDSRELQLDLQALQKELFELRFKSATEQITQTARFRQIRRQRARILTVLGERARAAAAEGKA